MATLYLCIETIDSSFEKQELDNCLSNFDRVVLITSDPVCLKLNEPGLEIHVLDFKFFRSSDYFLESLRYVIVLTKEFFGSRQYWFKPKLFISVLSLFLKSIYLSKEIKSIIKESTSGNEIFYSFWGNHWATALAILKSEIPAMKAIARVHGTDLFEERVPLTKRIAFRFFQLDKLEKIFSVSEAGTNYLKKKYPGYSHKVYTSRLGTRNYGINPFDEQKVFTIISCARIRNIKRIHRIAEILMHVNFPVKWIHLGSENKGDPTLPLLKANLKRLQDEKKNIEIEFRGEMLNEEIFEAYMAESINLFISVSETEGLPVSMMEAISFGIPILATDVGGCKEIVTWETGILVPPDFEAVSVAKEIENFAASGKNSMEFRKGVRLFWEKNFENDKNFKGLCEHLGVLARK